MALIEIAAMALMAQAPIVVTGEPGIGYEPLMDDRPALAVTEIEANTELQEDDPARLINLGIAYARLGQVAEARAMFEAAMLRENRMTLETSQGDWRDSRYLARQALAMLDNGELRSERLASR